MEQHQASRRKIVVSGTVQGVFFRRSARDEAMRLHLSGLARNQSDGTVLIEVEGPAEALDAFVAWVRHGPDQAVVTAVDVDDLDSRGDHDFRVVG